MLRRQKLLYCCVYTILTFYNFINNEECTFNRYDLTFLNGLSYAAQLTVVNMFVFLSF